MSPARLDARFLLADPDAEPIGLVGKGARELAESLRRSGLEAVAIAAGASDRKRDAPPPSCPMVFASRPTDSELALAASRCAPGGALFVETQGALRSVARLERRLATMGFVESDAYWHWPRFDGCTHVIPLGSPTALRYALSRVGSGRLERLRARVLRALFRAGMLGWTAGSVTVVARRESGDARLLPAYLDDASWSEGSPGSGAPGSFVMLTPRFRSSSRVIFLLLTEGAPDPALVIKVPRRPGCAATGREAERMTRIHGLRPGGFPSIPRPVATPRVRGRTFLVERAMPGRAMDRDMVRRNPARWCEAVLAWLIEIQLVTRSPLARTDLERLLETDLDELARIFPGEEVLIRMTRDLVRPLYAMDLVSVLEHGDLSHPNILAAPGGRIGVIDWESAEMRGLPMADLVFALTYIARAVARARSSGDVVRAVDGAFVREGGWARPYLHRYAKALELPDRSAGPLLVASWVRQIAGWARRAGHAETREDTGDSGALRADWRFAAWRHLVDPERRGGLAPVNG